MYVAPGGGGGEGGVEVERSGQRNVDRLLYCLTSTGDHRLIGTEAYTGLLYVAPTTVVKEHMNPENQILMILCDTG